MEGVCGKLRDVLPYGVGGFHTCAEAVPSAVSSLVADSNFVIVAARGTTSDKSLFVAISIFAVPFSFFTLSFDGIVYEKRGRWDAIGTGMVRL